MPKTLLPLTALTLTLTSLIPGRCAAQEAELKALEGTWLFVEDRTEGRPVDEGGAPMSMRFSLRVEEDKVVYPRPRGDETISLDGTATEKDNGNGSV